MYGDVGGDGTQLAVRGRMFHCKYRGKSCEHGAPCSGLEEAMMMDEIDHTRNKGSYCGKKRKTNSKNVIHEHFEASGIHRHHPYHCSDEEEHKES